MSCTFSAQVTQNLAYGSDRQFDEYIGYWKLAESIMGCFLGAFFSNLFQFTVKRRNLYLKGVRFYLSLYYGKKVQECLIS